LCIKGRYAFDFYDHAERLQAPLMRVNGKFEEASWSQVLETVAKKFNQTLADGGTFGVIGSNHTTNEENFYLQKFARQVLRTNNIDHRRTGDVVALLDALSGKQGRLATVADLYERKALLILGADLALEHPLLSYQIRANYRHHEAHIYTVTPAPVREDHYSVASIRAGSGPGEYFAALEKLGQRLKTEPELVILFDDSFQGSDVRRLVEFGASLGIPVSYICLVDYSNSRGAIDMGVTPELLPGYKLAEQPGMHLGEMVGADLSVLWVVGENPFNLGPGRPPASRKCGFLVVHDLFLTETAQQADVVLPSASAYEKKGTVTNVTGEIQRLKRAVNTMGAKPDLDIMGFIGREMGVAAALGPWTPDAVFEQIRQIVRGYQIPLAVIETGGAAQTAALNGRIPVEHQPGLVRSDHNGLFRSGTLGRYSKVLHSVLESRLEKSSDR
jgi:NADH-quinone oxidoreductase subunit G